MRGTLLGRFTFVVMTLAASSGCVSTYLDQKADLQAGGPQARVAAADQRLAAAKGQNTDLNDQMVAMKRDIDRNERALGKAQSDLKKVNRDLDSARKQHKIDEAAYQKLKADSERLRQEINDMDFQSKAAPPANQAEVEAKQRQLAQLERKKSELEKAALLATAQ